MNEQRRSWALACLLIVVFTLAGGATVSAAEQDRSMAPDFSAKDVGGREVSLSALRGKVVLLNFWATWCPACKDEMPRFNKLSHELRSRGVEVVAISSDYTEGQLMEYLKSNRFDFTIVYDEKRTVTRRYKLSYLPVTFLIDRKGFVVEKIAGEFEWPSPEIRKKIEKLL